MKTYMTRTKCLNYSWSLSQGAIFFAPPVLAKQVHKGRMGPHTGKELVLLFSSQSLQLAYDSCHQHSAAAPRILMPGPNISNAAAAGGLNTV